MILRECPFEEDIERYAQGVGWTRTGETVGSGQVKSRREVTWKAGPATRLYYVEDDMSPNCFVYVGSGTANMASSTGQEVYEKFHPWSLQDLAYQVDVASLPPELGQAILRLAIAAPYQFDPEVFERVAIGLTNSDSKGAGHVAVGDHVLALAGVSAIVGRYRGSRPRREVARARASDPGCVRRWAGGYLMTVEYSSNEDEFTKFV
jgi:hypothetical protein